MLSFRPDRWPSQVITQVTAADQPLPVDRT